MHDAKTQALIEVAGRLGVNDVAAATLADIGMLAMVVDKLDAGGHHVRLHERSTFLEKHGEDLDNLRHLVRKLDQAIKDHPGVLCVPEWRFDPAHIGNGDIENGLIVWRERGAAPKPAVLAAPVAAPKPVAKPNLRGQVKPREVDWKKLWQNLFDEGWWTIYCYIGKDTKSASVIGDGTIQDTASKTIYLTPVQWLHDVRGNRSGNTPWGNVYYYDDKDRRVTLYQHAAKINAFF